MKIIDIFTPILATKGCAVGGPLARQRLPALLVAGLLLGSGQASAEPDEVVLGKPQGYLVGTSASWYQMPHRVGAWSAMDQVPGLTTRSVAKAPVASPLPPMPQPPEIRYRYRNLGYSVDEYLERRRVTGLLVLKNGQVVTERYRYGRQPDARRLSFSMSKSVVSLLVGVALERGVLRSLDDVAQHYAPELAGSPYGATPLRALLRMSSGLVFTERYDGTDDIARLSMAAATGQPSVVSVLRGVSERHHPAGEKFVYASAETEVLGRVLAGATGRRLADLTAEWLWQPLGAEHDAFWVLSQGDQVERAWGFFNASLRDWARLGQLLAQDGRMGERQIVPRDYLLDATDPARQPPAFRPRAATPYWGYGYQFWLMPLKTRTFALQGVHGQTVLVQPDTGIVMVHTAVYAGASGATEADAYAERTALWMGVLATLGGDTRLQDGS
jgi:CubicO group peptidase (beta-lactamase class C family)